MPRPRHTRLPSPIPTCPSSLRTAETPSSPLTPLTPPPRPVYAPTAPRKPHTLSTTTSPSSAGTTTPPPPHTPLPWLWQCHECASVYTLRTTRRCLHCGHVFCSTPPAASSTSRRRKKKRAICRSEFDYAGWAEYNEWRRSMFASAERRDCALHCDHPSECLHAADEMGDMLEDFLGVEIEL